jgi:hypothetical protein
MTTTTPETVKWIKGNQAAQLLGIGPKALKRLAAARRVTVRHVAGSHPKYLLSDVERLARASTTPVELHPD